MLLAAAPSPGGGTVYQFLHDVGASDGTAHMVQSVSVGPFRVVVVLVVATVVTRMIPRGSRRLVKALQLGGPLLTSARASDRAQTVGAVVAGIFRTIVWVVALLTILGIAGIDLGPFVATATVIGAAVGFGAQSLVKDFLSGLLIVVEDQYDVGETITTGTITGVVETLNLRTTQVRDLDGTVWYIANGEIRIIGNSSDEFAQAVVDIVVPVGTDLNLVQALAEDEASAFAADAAWAGKILAPPQVLGVQKVAADGNTFRVTAKTPINANGDVARALRVRITERLRREGAAWADDDDSAPDLEAAAGPAAPAPPATAPTAPTAPSAPARPGAADY